MFNSFDDDEAGSALCFLLPITGGASSAVLMPLLEDVRLRVMVRLDLLDERRRAPSLLRALFSSSVTDLCRVLKVSISWPLWPGVTSGGGAHSRSHLISGRFFDESVCSGLQTLKT